MSVTISRYSTALTVLNVPSSYGEVNKSGKILLRSVSLQKVENLESVAAVLARALVVGRMHGCRQPERFGAGKETIPKLS